MGLDGHWALTGRGVAAGLMAGAMQAAGVDPVDRGKDLA